jgi:hypothetical protein
MRKTFLAFLVTLIAAPAPATAESLRWMAPAGPQHWGQFSGDIVAKFLADGRVMQLEKSFTYTGPDGRKWPVPVGATTDGASVPPAFWFAYPPYSGPYRAAAIMHDYYCTIRTRSSRATHKAFYTAMRAAGVPARSARTLYIAVVRFGPQWYYINPETPVPPPVSIPVPASDPAPTPKPPLIVGSIPEPKAAPRPEPKIKAKPPAMPQRVKASKPKVARVVEKPRIKSKPKAKTPKMTEEQKQLTTLFPKAAPEWSPHGRTQF